MSRGLRVPRLATSIAFVGQLLCLAAVTVFLLGLVGAGQQRAAATTRSAWLGLTVTAAQTVKVGDPFALHLTVTNQTGRPCALAPTSQGTVGLSVRRDGARLYPGLSVLEPIVDFRSSLAGTAQTVAPGGAVSFGASSTAGPSGSSLSTVSLASDGTAVGAWWRLDQPGSYAISVTYAMPGGPGQCPGGSGTATITVKVVKCANSLLRSVWPALPWLFGGGVVLALPMTVSILERRRPVLVRTAAITVCTALLGLGAPMVASADIAVETSLQSDYNECFATYKTNDPLNILPELLHISHVDVIREPGDLSWSGRAPDGGLGLQVGWNPSAPNVFSDDVSEEKCSTLYHELIHAYDLALGVEDDDTCSDAYPMKKEEIRATRGENQYRENRHFVPRSTRGRKGSPDPKPLPPGADSGYDAIAKQCEDLKPPPPPPPARNSGGCSLPERRHPLARGRAAGAAGIGPDFGSGSCSTGDPHITTFDGRRYDFQTVGEFVLAEAAGIEVQARQAPLEDSRFASVNSAVGLRVGSDRLSVAMADGVRIQLNGTDVVPSTDATRLPGGGSLKVADDGQFEVGWPDGTVARVGTMSGWGLSLMLFPSPALKGRTHGILGDYDGDPADDLVTTSGTVLADPPEPKQLFGAFADSWRVTDATSLLPYPQGTNTATFTDRTFPDKPITDADLDQQRADSARKLCRSLGVTDSVALAACVLDIALSGQPAFATNAEDVDRHADGAQQQPPGGGVQPGGTLHDGDHVATPIAKAGQVDEYHLDLGPATVFHLADLTGENGPGGRFTLTFAVDPPDGGDAPGFTTTSNYQYRVKQGGSHTLRVSRSDGDTGPYSFTVVTSKERPGTMTMEHEVVGDLDVRGRVNLYPFTPATAGKLRLKGAAACDINVAVTEESPAPHVRSWADLCDDPGLPAMQAKHHYLLIVWSEKLKTGAYSFTPTING